MTEIIRHCPDCGRSRLFAQHHGPGGRCPDSADRWCPEWYCVVCGATLLIGAVPPAAVPAAAVPAATVPAATVPAATVPAAAVPAAAAGSRHRVA